MHDIKKNSQLIRAEALRLGFLDCGITSAEPSENVSEHLKDWIRNGFHGEMKYMEDHLPLRSDPRKFFEGAKSVIVVLQNYYTTEKQKDPSSPVMAMYSFGRDYHTVIKKKLKKLLDFIQAEIQSCQGKIFVDSAAVHEKSLAQRAGLGWIGKNSLLLSQKTGSFIFIGGIITDLKLEYSKDPGINYCGNCILCMEACPAGAIVRPGVLDVRKCISYLTIESRKCGLPAELKGNFHNRVYGCDICQDVCPWNKNLTPHSESELMPNPELLEMTRNDWYNLDEKKFNEIFKSSTLKRLKYSVLRRNLEFLL
jgi:epoxyqueuosine reductase